MSYFETRDGTRLFYADWGPPGGKPVVFVPAWGLSVPFWQNQMMALSDRGFRCIAYDRRGHGRSDDPGHGYDCDTLADDLGALMNHLYLRNTTLVSLSMGSNEIVRYFTRHGDGRVARLVFSGTSLPFRLKTEDNPDGELDRAQLTEHRATWQRDFPKWLADNARPFVVESTSQATIDWVIRSMLEASMKALVDCSVTDYEIDFRAELGKIRLPTLFIHGTADVSNPIEATTRRALRYLPNSKLLVYEDAPHGLPITHAARFNTDLLAFIGG